jgi:hypothetical protein
MDVMSSAGTDKFMKLAPNVIIEHICRRVLRFGVRMYNPIFGRVK